jgi:hypothetical protein
MLCVSFQVATKSALVHVGAGATLCVARDTRYVVRGTLAQQIRDRNGPVADDQEALTFPSSGVYSGVDTDGRAGARQHTSISTAMPHQTSSRSLAVGAFEYAGATLLQPIARTSTIALMLDKKQSTNEAVSALLLANPPSLRHAPDVTPTFRPNRSTI